ncbi:MAG: hypothetical protein JAY88_02555 [Candidatus Thiodiazotropha lotti]|nr:hypothetical protein [Candidatus Thiodiazotropha lotti]MCW4185947.1 hypothetical protein [Candidatus Thiodiazotropha lotti]
MGFLSVVGGGVSGGFLGSAISTAMSSTSPFDMACDIVSQFGMDKLIDGLFNSGIAKMADTAREMIDDSGLPDGIKDTLHSYVDQWQQNSTRGGVPCECQEMCNELHDAMNNCSESSSSTSNGNSEVDSPVDTAMSQLCESSEEEAKKCTNGSSNGNWLVILASALGKQAGEHLKNMVELGEKMGAMDSEAEPEAFAQTQSEFQAASQIFKMFQESISTMIKSIGEGLSSVARKQ